MSPNTELREVDAGRMMREFSGLLTLIFYSTDSSELHYWSLECVSIVLNNFEGGMEAVIRTKLAVIYI